MIEHTVFPRPFRAARSSDIEILTRFVDSAGLGLPHYCWGLVAGANEAASEVGRRRVGRDSGPTSWRNAVVAAEPGEGVVAGLIGYRVADAPGVRDALPPVAHPVRELEGLARGLWFINVIATLPAFRRRGYGSRLLDIAETLGRGACCDGLSLVVSDTNLAARRLYESKGFRCSARRAMVKIGWVGEGSEWLLMTRHFTPEP